jgi:hypothetical protein
MDVCWYHHGLSIFDWDGFIILIIFLLGVWYGLKFA